MLAFAGQHLSKGKHRRDGMTIIINGKAGTGKSWLIEMLNQMDISPRPLLLGTTGVSASIIGGQTLHSYLRISSYKDLDFTSRHPLTERTIILDEASMLPQNIWNWMKIAFPKCNFILVGDWNQLPPIKDNPLDIGAEHWDYAYNLDVQHRSTDDALNHLLNSILEGDTEKVKKFILSRKRTLNIGSKIVAFKNSSLKEWNDKFSMWDAGTTVIFNTAGFYNDEGGSRHKRHYKDCKFINNERFTVKNTVKTEDSYVTLTSLLDGKDKIASLEEYSLYFNVAESMTAHKMQGQSIKGPLTVYLDDIMTSKDCLLMTRMLYVACSRVSNLNQLYFGIADIEKTLKDFKIVALHNELKSDCFNNEDLLPILGDLLKSKKEPSILDLMPTMGKSGVINGNKSDYPIVDLAGVSSTHARSKVVTKIEKVESMEVVKTYHFITPHGKSNKPAIFYTNKTDTITYLNHPTPDTQFETLNPIYPTPSEGHKTPRTQDNVASMKKFLFECDNPADRDFFIEQGKKYGRRIVDSGNKSIHVIIQLRNAVPNIETYKLYWNYINSHYFDGKADRACGEPSRLTRTPNAIRDNGNIQTLLFESNKFLCIKETSVMKSSVIKSIPIMAVPSSASKLWIEAQGFENGTVADGTKHTTLPNAVKSWVFNGYSLEQIKAILKPYKADFEQYAAYLYSKEIKS
jgi:hypothetical protein